MANWKALYTTRGLCECVANSLTRAVLNTAMGDATLLQPLECVNLVRSSCEVQGRIQDLGKGGGAGDKYIHNGEGTGGGVSLP